MKEIIDVRCFYQYAKNETVEDLENFDKVYNGVMESNYTFCLEDIVLLCELQIQNFPYMEPHQESKIMEIVFVVINECGISAGFQELIKGLEKIIKVKEFLVGMYLRMMINSYSEENIITFSRLLSNSSNDFKDKIKEIVVKSITLDSKRYEVKGNIILENIEL